ncbi:MAG: hypothetical protein ABSB36_07740 [Candidatus Dormibacteria bacterium]
MVLRAMPAGELARLARVHKNTRNLRELAWALVAYPTIRVLDVLLTKPEVA